MKWVKRFNWEFFLSMSFMCAFLCLGFAQDPCTGEWIWHNYHVALEITIPLMFIVSLFMPKFDK